MKKLPKSTTPINPRRGGTNLVPDLFSNFFGPNNDINLANRIMIQKVVDNPAYDKYANIYYTTPPRKVEV